ncbi:MAG: NAD-dependent epimerase/dehydratase family protein [Bacteroidetes bacterium]|jgi:nucleoside-diphosphate-sugar epimerase|nr:NAD-dependent epimerase/dehydratase family protein [Bacteroidota bacterium]
MILVTGATGLVGSHLALELVKRGETVRGTYQHETSLKKVKETARLYGSEYLEYYQQIDWVEAEITDYGGIYQAIENVNQVYHCAGMISFHPGDKRKLLEVNYRGTRNIVNACLEKKVDAFCMMSSIAALGKPNDEQWYTEESFWKNSKSKGGYGYSKYMGEMEVWRAISEGLNAVIVNPSVIIGAGHWNSGSGLLFSRIHKGLRYYTPGVTGYVDVHDVVNTSIKLMEQKAFGERYILNAQNLSFQEIFESIAHNLQKNSKLKRANYRLVRFICRLEWLKWKLTGIKPRITIQNLKSAFDKKYYANQKVCDQLDYRFLPIDASIERTAALFKK